jgi:predicted anti-sigma-YlaC factor YlaD
MSDCETCEISISALADGELPAEDLLPTLDHLMECPSCQAFYRDVRALSAATGDPRLPASASGEAPEEIWRRIEAAAAPALSQRGHVRPWAMRLAAAILLVASLWGALAALRSLRPAGQPIEVTLGEDRGRMTEQRFVDLTVELLRADSRYHQEMFQVLTAVIDRGGRQETPADYDAPLPEGDDESGDWQPSQGARRLS